MITFYPGPSKVYPQIEQYLQDAYCSGLLSMNHRSEGFMDMLKETLRLLHLKLAIPPDYGIYFVSSATEAWEIIAQSLTVDGSLHYYNGAFGKKWYSYTSHIISHTNSVSFGIDQVLTEALEKKQYPSLNQHVLCLTHNETSNGSQIAMSELQRIKAFTTGLIAIDATSSLGGVQLDWHLGDVWFASVQKCLGLPAGMGILICSPKAIEVARKINDKAHYNSLLFIHENFEKYQTHYTPNTLSIYLLMRVMEQVAPINQIAIKIKQQAKQWYDFFEQETIWQPLITNHSTRSDTVITLKGNTNQIAQLKKYALNAGIILGNGYGEWKNDTFRVANFPAITIEEIAMLEEFFRNTRQST